MLDLKGQVTGLTKLVNTMELSLESLVGRSRRHWVWRWQHQPAGSYLHTITSKNRLAVAIHPLGKPLRARSTSLK